MKFRWETKFKKTEIGEIPKDWEVKKLGEVVEVEWGNTNLTKKIYKEDGYPVFSATGQDGYADFYEREGEAVIVSAIGAYCGVCFYAKNKWTAIKNTLVLQNKKIPCDIKFLFYFLNDKEKWPELGSGQPFISKSAAEEVLIVYPPLPEQSRIATVLSWFDDLIEVKKRQNEILEKTAMAIFKSWFTDFEPFRDREFVYSEELGKEIPKGWEVKRLYELCKILRGLNFKSNEVIFEYVKGYIPVLRTNNIKGGFEIDFSDLMFVKEDKINPEKLLKENDILLSASNGNPELVGNFAVFLNTFTDLAFSFGAFIYLIRVNNHEMFPYVYLSLSDNSFREYVASAISGTNINNLNLSDLKNFPVLIPPSHILQSFHSLVEPLFQKIILNQKQIMTLRKIRDTLLPLLVFGKLRVEEV
jgi:type I restriction enzyme S subunit